jgi:hypothetical protein
VGRFVAVLRPRWPGAVRRLGADGGAKPVVFLRAPGFLAAAGRQLPRLDASFTPWLPEPGPVSSGLELVKGTSALSRLTRTPTGFLFASGERAALDAFLDRLAAADGAASRSLEIEVRVVKAATSEEALAPGAPVHESATLAAGLHASAGAFLSHEESAVEGYQVLVAEEAAIATPDVKNLFRGLVVRARALDIGADATRAELEILRCDFGPRERSVSDATDIGDLERIPRRHTTLQRVVELSANAPVVVGDLGLFGNVRYFAVAAGRAVGP